MSRRPALPELKSLLHGDMDAALAMAQRCRDVAEPEEAESICLDILASDPGNQQARVLLLLARTDLLDRGSPAGVALAREALADIDGAYQKAYYEGLICERRARYLLRARGRQSSFVAWDWFGYAMEHFEEAMRLAPERIEPILRFNTCIRLLEANRQCVPDPDQGDIAGIE